MATGSGPPEGSTLSEISKWIAEAMKRREAQRKRDLQLERAKRMEALRKRRNDALKRVRELRELRKQTDKARQGPSQLAGIDPAITDTSAEIGRLQEIISGSRTREAQIREIYDRDQKRWQPQIDEANRNDEIDRTRRTSMRDQIDRLMLDEEWRRHQANTLKGRGISISEKALADPSVMSQDELLSMIDGSKVDRASNVAIRGARERQLLRSNSDPKAVVLSIQQKINEGTATAEDYAKLGGGGGVGVEEAAVLAWQQTPEDVRQEAIDKYLNAVLAYTPEELASALAADPDGLGIRYRDAQGHTVDKDGNPWTAQDFLTGDVPLQIDETSLTTAVGKLLPQYNDYRGRNPKYGFHLEDPYLQPADMMIRFLMLPTMGPQGVMQLAEYQKRLENADYLDPTDYQAGVFNNATADAFQQLFALAFPETFITGGTIDEVLTRQEGARAERLAEEAAARGGGGGGGGAYSVSDEVGLAMIADQAGQTLLGRNLTLEERDMIVSKIQGLEAAEGQKTSGPIQAIDPMARAEAMIREMAPDDTKAHDMAAAFDMFAGLLGENMGLGNSVAAFGRSTIGTNTGAVAAPSLGGA
jgi:hypothetical protein